MATSKLPIASWTHRREGRSRMGRANLGRTCASTSDQVFQLSHPSPLYDANRHSKDDRRLQSATRRHRHLHKLSSCHLQPLLAATLLTASLCFLIVQRSLEQTSGSHLLRAALGKLTPFHDVDPDAYLDPPGFIESRLFVSETHHVITKDNYVLTMHRIVNPLVPQHLRNRLKPALLQHGLFTSSFNFIIASDANLDVPHFDPRFLTGTHLPPPGAASPLQNRPLPLPPILTRAVNLLSNQLTGNDLQPYQSDSLAFTMANQGYDVWMANSRGSTYSLNHTKYDHRLHWQYWDFSFHEIALYDLPAQIDYILKLRQRQSLAFVGHSQGNLAMFVLQSLQPHWANKVKPFIAIAPIAFIPNVYLGAMRLLIKSISLVLTPTQLNRILKGQVFPKRQSTERALDLVCLPKWSTFICDVALSMMLGSSLLRANQTRTAKVAHHIPEGTSVLNLLHFAQLIESGQFKSFDFGARENERRYKTKANPRYPIERISSPDIALIAGRTDPLSTLSNVAITRSMLKVPLLDDYVVPDLAWGHSDHMYAEGSGRLTNSRIISLIDRYRLVP